MRKKKIEKSNIEKLLEIIAFEVFILILLFIGFILWIALYGG